MKKHLAFLLTLTLLLSLTACGNSDNTRAPVSETGSNSTADQALSVNGAQAPEKIGAPAETPDKPTAITLTVGDIVMDAYLNDSAPAQSLLTQLPLTVTLNDSDNDFCGGHLDIENAESDVQSGYQNGDLAFWPPASNFVIFVSGEENSANTGNLVILGHITSSQEMLDTLDGRIDVAIALAS